MGNFFDRFTQIKESFIGGKGEESVVGIDIGTAFIKVVQLKKKKGAAVLETYGELAVGPYAGFSVGQAAVLDTEKLSAALNDLFKEANVTTKIAGIAMPLSTALLPVIEMPALGERELAKMIPIEARKYIPVPIGEVTLDWQIVPKAPDAPRDSYSDAGGGMPGQEEGARIEKVEVLVAAIHNEAINRYRDIIRRNELQKTFLEIETFSALRSTSREHMAPVMLVDFGASSAKVVVAERGVVRSTHIVNKGSQDITLALSRSMGISASRAESIKREVGLSTDDKDKDVYGTIMVILDNILAEAGRVIFNYERKYNKTIKKVIFTGGGALLKGFQPLAQKQLETEVILGDPFSKVATPAFLEPVLKSAGPEFAVAIGAALRKLEETGE